jgi:hypothetical protein
MISTGLPRTVPFGIVPGTRHVVTFTFVRSNGDPITQAGTTWAMTAHDAHTGEQLFAYSSEVDAHRVQFIASAPQTLTLDPFRGYTLRVTRTSPGPDLIFSGPVLFQPPTLKAA